jgi:hypothetical protein
MIGILNLQAQRNATFNEVPFEILIDNVPLDLTGAVIRMQVKKDACSSPVFTLTSVASDGITITDAVNGQFKINEQIITIPTCNYEYDIKITLASNEVKYYVGGLFQVVKTITN